jgi:hypothetical protein
MKRMHYFAKSLVIASFAIAMGVFPAQAEPLPGAPVATSTSQAAFTSLRGRWVRLDGGYVISIKSVDAGGKLDASYANSNPLPFYTATADGGALKIFFELRAGGYHGSTYTLNYDVASDQLKGTYYQAVAKKTFECFRLQINAIQSWTPSIGSCRAICRRTDCDMVPWRSDS